MEDSSATKRREKTDCKMHDTSKKPLSRYASRKNHLQQLTPGATYVATDAPSALGGTGKRVEEEEEPEKFLAPARTGLVVGSSPRKKVVRSDESPKKRWFGGRPAGKGSASANQQIRSISASYPSLNNNNNNERKRSVDDGSSGGDRRGRSKRPVTILPVKSTNVTLRRGQQPKTTTTTIPGDHHQNHNNQGATTPDDLSRSSSVTNLNVAAEQQHHQQNKIAASTKGAKPKKSESKDKLDKLLVVSSGNDKKHERKASGSSLSRNNNREPPPPLPSQGPPPHLVEDLHQEVEILQRQLERMSNEKSSLALQLGEQTGQLNSLQTEVVKLKMLQDQASLQLEQLTEENTLLRNRLRDVAHSPLSDNEKQQLLYESHQRHHSSSAPASIATNLLDDGGDITTCPTPEWDKHSSSNVSEVSVACLQDKINQMQETHYSTNEELQATLQELTDLQRQLTELQQENERLIEEKNLMFESLCRQTERLNDSRTEVENLKQLLYKDAAESATSNNGGGQKDFESAAEREQKLVDLLKSAQEEREVLLVKQEQLDSDLKESRSTNLLHGDEIMQLKDRVRTLESTLDAKHAEHKLLDQELALARDQSSSRQIEINRLKDLLENARTKINELEQDRTMSDKSELDEILDNTRKEKDALESEVAHMKEHLALGRNEIDKLKEQLSLWQEECKVTRNNAKTTQSDLEYKVEKLMREKEQLTEELSRFQEAVNELQVQNQCQMDDKRQLSAVLSETQRNLNEAERKIGSLENELADAKRLRQEQEEEWEKFQNDLLTSVRVANDFKTEAQQDLQRMIMENKAERERVKQLEAQIDKLKVTTESLPPMRPTSFPVDDVATRRQKAALTRQNSRQSVRSLIESIENAAKPVSKGLPSSLNMVSRSSSASSIGSMTSSDLRTPSSPLGAAPSMSPLRTPGGDWSSGDQPSITNNHQQQQIKTPLKEQQPNKINNNNCTRDWNKTVISDSLSGKGDMMKSNKTVEDSYRESILQKGIDFARRNSYSDLIVPGERKDPLNGLVKNGGSKRNALLKWCQNKTVGYRNIDITNFSSSWNDGLALCALLHTYLPDRIPYDSLTAQEKRRNFSLAFSAAESVGIPTTLNINDMIQLERPDWQQVMSYVTAIYKHFET